MLPKNATSLLNVTKRLEDLHNGDNTVDLLTMVFTIEQVLLSEGVQLP